MSEIEDYGVTVEEYLDGLAAGIDILELKRLEAKGIPTNLALEVMASRSTAAECQTIAQATS
jgi:hypothetical protein